MCILTGSTIVIFIDHCLSTGFPSAVDLDIHGNGRGERRITTRLFPDMKFGCFGTIVQMTAVAVGVNNRQQTPKIQLWRENGTQPGLYYKTRADLRIKRSDPPCYRTTYTSSSRLFQCTMNEDYRIPVQPGDFLGLEIPPIPNNDFEIYFKPGGPTNFVFQGQLDSSIDLSTEPYATTHDEPQITFLVVIGIFLVNTNHII